MKKKIRRSIAWLCIFLTLHGGFLSTRAFALSEGPSQPEAMQFEPVDTTDLVNLATGDFTYNLPLFKVPGAGEGFPLNLSYHSGIGLNQEATWVGLGWSLNPGAINRSVMGLPDDYKAALVRTDIDGRLEHSGLGISVSYGPVGISVGFDSWEGFSVNGITLGAQVGGLGAVTIGAGPDHLSVGTEYFKVKAGKDGLNVGTDYADVKFKNGEFSLDPAYGKIFEGTGKLVGSLFDDGDKAGDPDAGKFGPREHKVDWEGIGKVFKQIADPLEISLSSDKGKVGFKDIGSAEFSQKFSPTDGITTAWALSIPIYNYLTVGAWQTRWRLKQTLDQLAYGHLQQKSFLKDFNRFAAPGIDPLVPTYERDINDDFIFPAQDRFLANAPGLSGNFQAFIEQPYMLWEMGKLSASARSQYPTVRKEGDSSDDFGNREHNQFKSYEFGKFRSADPVFRFLGDPGLNFATMDGPVRWGRPSQNMLPGTNHCDPDQSGYGTDCITENRHSSRVIEPVYTWSAGSGEHASPIAGFKVTATDGKVYEFMRPVYNYCRYSQTTDKRDHKTVVSFSQVTRPYAESWLLSGIKGPDYRDTDGDGQLSPADAGYWVAFDYQEYDRPVVWRSPYSGEAPDFIAGQDVTQYSTGIRQQVILSSIRTSTHHAEFETSIRADRKMASTDQNLDLSGQPVDRSPRGDGKFNYIFHEEYLTGHPMEGWVFPGNWLKHLEATQNDRVILTLHHPHNTSKKWTYKKSDFSEISFQPSDDPRGIGYTFLKPRQHKEPNSSYYLRAQQLPFFHLGGLMHTWGPEASAPKLDRIVLYANGETLPARSVELGYDYSLCGKTPNSYAREESPGSTDGGKLTLKTVRMKGRSGKSGLNTIPPYRFEYANGDAPGTGLNPDYNELDWDVWGAYRDPDNGADRDQLNHDCPQDPDRAHRGAAWSLSKITMPTGGALAVEYERDDYFWVGRDIDLEKLVMPEELLGRTIPLDLPQLTSPETVPVLGYEAVFDSPTQPEWFKCDKQLVDQLGLRQGDPLVFIARNFTWGSPTGLDNRPRIIWRHEMHVARIANIYSNDNIARIRLDKPFPRDLAQDPAHDISFLIPPPVVYGDKSRVKRIISHDGFEARGIRYEYRLPDGRSSGVTPSLPKDSRERLVADHGYFRRLFQDIRYTGREVRFDPPLNSYNAMVKIDEGVGFDRLFPDHKLNYNRPGPAVIYSRVETFPEDGDGRVVAGKSVYEFNTFRDFGYETTDNKDEETLSITDNSIGMGLPKSVTHYARTRAGLIQRPVSETVFDYRPGSGLKDEGKVLLFSQESGEFNHEINTSRPLGSILQKFAFRWQKEPKTEDDNPRTNRRRVDYLMENVYQVRRRHKEYYYHPTQFPGETSTSETEVRNLQWDAMTGLPMCSYSTNYPHGKVSFHMPAYWQYAGMERQNMLEQNCWEAEYDYGTRDTARLRDYSPPPDDIIASTISTWSDSWPDGQKVWRKNDYYVYDRAYDRQDGSGWTMFDRWDETGDRFPAVTRDWPWRMVRNVSRYNHRSKVEEVARRDGTYEAAIFGYGGNLQIAHVRNAKRSQVLFWDFEEDCGANCAVSGKTGRALQVRGQSSPWQNKLVLSPGKYTMQFWVKKGSAAGTYPILIALGSGSNRQEYTIPMDGASDWKLVEQEISIGQVETGFSVSLNTQGDAWHLLDHLRIHPAGARMKTFTYDLLSHELLAITDENLESTYYEYDGHDRLRLKRDNEGNIISRYTYHYGDQ